MAEYLIVVLTCAVDSVSKRSLIVVFTVSGPVSCSGARRRDKVLDVVSTAIHGGAAALNNILDSFLLISGGSVVVNIKLWFCRQIYLILLL